MQKQILFSVCITAENPLFFYRKYPKLWMYFLYTKILISDNDSHF